MNTLHFLETEKDYKMAEPILTRIYRPFIGILKQLKSLKWGNKQYRINELDNQSTNYEVFLRKDTGAFWKIAD